MRLQNSDNEESKHLFHKLLSFNMISEQASAKLKSSMGQMWQLPGVKGHSHSSLCHFPCSRCRVVTHSHRSGNRATDVFFIHADGQLTAACKHPTKVIRSTLSFLKNDWPILERPPTQYYSIHPRHHHHYPTPPPAHHHPAPLPPFY